MNEKKGDGNRDERKKKVTGIKINGKKVMGIRWTEKKVIEINMSRKKREDKGEQKKKWRWTDKIKGIKRNKKK